ncbi:hypothetical protein [Chlorogloeopsis sp. ULAP02]|uniref:hypothetical protein n=1 Tax=Chlorogloeopsis sp. ULAP02 TaxID=3107926 RepID=UPI00398A75AF
MNYEPHPFCRSRQVLIYGCGFLVRLNFVLLIPDCEKALMKFVDDTGAVRLEFWRF